jgi:bifunctional non-homologous end joining protein LigD
VDARVKFDGYRLIARKEGDQVRLWTRPGSDYSARFTRIREALAALRIERAVLDGEAVVLRPDATSDFFALRSTEGQAAAVLVAFDVLALGGQDVRAERLERRRARVQQLLKPPRGKAAALGAVSASGIRLSEPIAGRPDAIFRRACAMGLEGIVSKRVDSRYTSGRTMNWLKARNPMFMR